MNTVVTIENGMECVFIMKVHHGGLVHARTSANACKIGLYGSRKLDLTLG